MLSQFSECSVMFRLFSECSVMFRQFSEYQAQQLVCSEFLDFPVYFEIRVSNQVQRMNAPNQNLFSIKCFHIPVQKKYTTHSN